MFVQIHTLHSYPASLLNRDDTGRSKTIPFGGYTRTRISSQCLKRHWRESDIFKEIEHNSNIQQSIRSRIFFDELIYQVLLKDSDIPTTHHDALKNVCESVANKLFSTAKNELNTSQVIVLGMPEINTIKDEIKNYVKSIDLANLPSPILVETTTTETASPKAKAKKEKETTKETTFDALYKSIKIKLDAIKGASCGLDASLFGRMVTSDYLSRKDSCVHVAHAFTVHAQQSESDYFSVIDDLLARNGELGAGHVNSTELTSGLYYNYVVIDLGLLYSNLFGCHYEKDPSNETDKANKLEVIIHLVQKFAQAVCTVSTGAKVGSTAAYAYASFGMFEVGKTQPRSCANAFLKPVSLKGDLFANAYTQLTQYINRVDEIYPQDGLQRASFNIASTDLQLGDKIGLSNLGSWLKTRIDLK